MIGNTFIFAYMPTRFTLYFLLFLLPRLSFGRQVTIQEIKEESPLNKKYEYRFPRIVYEANKGVAAKINNTLAADFLRIDPKKVRKSLFEAVWPQQKNAMPELSEIDWIVHTNTPALFSIDIGAQGCGAYCEYFDTYYTFDLKTGERLTLKQLFTKEGLIIVRDSVNSHKKQVLQATIKTHQGLLRDTAIQLTTDNIQSVKNTIELYQDCLAKGGIETVEDCSFYLRGGLFIRLERCSAHYNRNLDDLGNIECSFDYIDMKQYLTPYGQQLLLK
jgi:hypothetical protein